MSASTSPYVHGDSGTTKSIVILIGNDGSSKKLVGTSNLSSTVVPLVVWTLQERSIAERSGSNAEDNNATGSAPLDPWRYTLRYYEFLDDTARWTHLDQLLLQLVDTNPSSSSFANADGEESDSDEMGVELPSIHVGTSENLDKAAVKKTKGNDGDDNASQLSQRTSSSSSAAALSRTHKLVESLQTFLDTRLFANSPSINAQLHCSVPVDPQKVNHCLSQLLVKTEEAQLAVRGNIQLDKPMIRQGLALLLQSEGLYGSSNSLAITSMEASIKVVAGILTSHLVMDSTAAQAIHLLPPANDAVATVVGGTVHTNSLWGLLSKPCLTVMGKKLLQVWLRQPLVDLTRIQQRQDAVTQLLGMAKDSIREGLACFSGNGAGNLARLGPALAKYRQSDDEDSDGGPQQTATRVVDTKKPLETLYHLYNLASRHLPRLLDCMECIKGNDDNDQSSPILLDLYKQIEGLVAELDRSIGLAEAVLDLDHAPEEFLVKPEYAEELGDFYQEIEAVHKAVNEEHRTIQEAWDDIQPNKNRSSQVRLERVEDNMAWQFRLPDTNDSKLVESLGPKIKIHRILKNGVYFSSLELRQLSSKYQELHTDYNRVSRKIVQDAMGIASTYSTVVERVAQAVSSLDVFCALAYTAAMSPNGYCRPHMTDSDDDGAGIVLKGARHPCLELQDGLDFIPNDIQLTFPNAQLLVSGPNMGGKSVYIRSLGAIVCMAQIGSYVPCAAATINVCHSILARVGAGDLQERGISTFMAEMLESSAILRAATRRSLIIIDELGRGTSTFDGYGLARAITEYLRDRVRCMVVFATHFHELTTIRSIQNCHVTAQKGNQGLTFLYQVHPGPCLESFGIQVAEMAHMPKKVIEDAKKRALELENFTTGVEDEIKSSKRQKISKDKLVLLRFAKMTSPSSQRKGELLSCLRARIMKS
ncbi:DNA mismatch repair protein MutS [Nitzschia inconspicua]|uniref:DNA mismatch repair protein MutS n=1 Tax=Nitzschia inconspicua TaxID=303405 RepID=A0A9K3KYA2_9STRA|nr:DNA mismatch repair protein MutS [Nitzschia inconspicua]